MSEINARLRGELLTDCVWFHRAGFFLSFFLNRGSKRFLSSAQSAEEVFSVSITTSQHQMVNLMLVIFVGECL